MRAPIPDRKFWLCIGVSAAVTALVACARITDKVYESVQILVVLTYVGGNVAQKRLLHPPVAEETPK